MALKLDRARQIQGWMLEEELEWLAQIATRHYRIAEVGSWKGRSTVALAENTRGMVFAIDTWLGSEEHTPEEIGPKGWLFQQFSENVKGLPVVPIMGTSLAAAEHFQSGGFRLFDMIFIDAAHDLASVRADIEAWRPLLQPGGIMCGHDFNDWPGNVAEAVSLTLGRVERPAGTIWLKQFKGGSMTQECTGQHRYFVANDAATEGKVIIFLVCTQCGEGKKLEFEVADKNARVSASPRVSAGH